MKKKFILVAIVLLSFLALKSVAIVYGNDLTIWEKNNTVQVYKLFSITKGENTYIAVGENGYIKTSIDRQNWVSRNSNVPYDLLDVTYGNPGFVVVHEKGIIFSSDAISWSKVLDTSNSITAVAWNGNLYVAVGNNGQIFISTNGVEWNKSKFVHSGNFTSIASNGHDFVAVDDKGIIIYSNDGENWTSIRADGYFGKLNSVFWDSNRFIITGDLGYVSSSKDLLKWTRLNSNLSINNPVGENTSLLRHMAYDGEYYYILLGRTGILKTNFTDYWIQSYSGMNLNNIVFYDGYLLGATSFGNVTVKNINSNSWEPYTRVYNSNFSSIAWNGQRYVVTGGIINPNGSISSSGIWTSEDGLSWDCVHPESYTLEGVIWDGKQFIAFGYKTIMRSTDGLVWETDTNDFDNRILSIEYNGSKYVATDVIGNIWNSDDSVNWKIVLSLKDNNFISDVKWDGKKFVGVGTQIYTSLDGVNWMKCLDNDNLPKGNAYLTWLTNIEFNGNTYVAVGLYGTVVTSLNGLDWEVIDLGTSTSFYTICWDGENFILPSDGVYYTSKDGTNWTNNSYIGKDILDIIRTEGKYIAIGKNNLILTGKDSKIIDIYLSTNRVVKPEGSIFVLNLYAVLDNGKTENISRLANWTSSNLSVVSINSGQGTILQPGKAFITVTYEDFSKTIDVLGIKGKIIEITVGKPVMTVRDYLFSRNANIIEIDPGRSTKSIIINGRMLLPIRAIVEELGGQIKWDAATKKVTISMYDQNIVLTIDKLEAEVDGVVKKMDVAPILHNGRTMLPLRFISENLGLEVDWDHETQTASIKNFNLDSDY
ncbi:UNVERIFIED_CONTAM: copper amine oxidase-like protein [Acetivibrio alkalicellulosi]